MDAEDITVVSTTNANNEDEVDEVYKDLKAYETIKDFVSSLSDIYGRHDKPLALYNRLLIRADPEDHVAMERHVELFRVFFRRRGKAVKESFETFSKISQDEKIKYGQRIYIDIGFFIKRASRDIKEKIRHHLLTILATLNPDDSNAMRQLKALESLNIDTSSKEGSFVNDIMTQFKDTMENDENPMTGLVSMLPKMLMGFEKGLKTGEMNLPGLLNTITSTMGSLMGPDAAKIINTEALQSLFSGMNLKGEDGENHEVRDVLRTAMGVQVDGKDEVESAEVD